MADAVRVDGLGPGDHACLTFSDPQERLDLVAAFVRDGLRLRHKVLCWTDSISPAELGRGYDRSRFDAVTLAFAARAHPRTIAAQAYHDDVLLRICRQYRPPGVRVAGEHRYLDTFGVALTESMRLDRNPYLNLTGLDYIDAACATAVVQAAGQLPRSRHVTIACRGLVRTVLDLVGAGTADRIRMRPRDDQS